MAQVYRCFQFFLIFSAVINPAWRAAFFINFTSTARVGNLRPVGRIRPTEAFYPVRDHLLSSGRRPFFFFNNRYAAVNRWNDLYLLINSSEKGVNFWRRPFFLVFAIHLAKKRREFLVKTFLFWSAGMVVARWNLVRTGCGPLVQKVADPCSTATIRFVKVFISIIFCLAGLLSHHS